ncbi:MAG TPA: Cd(II)/Pb(II)-responsive transcriptional regulator [Chthoniobacterales bacterium]
MKRLQGQWLTTQKQAMKIGELAATVQCTVETIRYYEKEGLLPKPARGGNNYRFYGPNHRQRLLFIRNCRALDMSQEEIRALLGLKEKSEGDCGSVNALLDKHISHVDARIGELRRLKSQLTGLRQKCRNKTTVSDCRILQGLSEIRPGDRPPRATHLG